MTETFLTNVSVAFVYQDATFKTETVSQTHMGETLIVLEERTDWVRVRQMDNYEGWVARFFLVEKPAGWDHYELFFPADQISWIYLNPERTSTTLRDITLLSGLPVLDRQDGWVQVLLPDGNQGWLEDRPRHQVIIPDVEQIIQTAFSFLGIQYFWGGRTPKGFDCSGFTQTCFALNGIQLPRDAWQQSEIGKAVDNNFKSWQVGDLLFFSEKPNRITHVAISLGDGDFIHASGFIKLNSLNPDHQDLYIEKYARIFTRIMRIL